MTVLAEYSKDRVLTFTLGPILVFALFYFLLSPYPLSNVFSVENWTRSTPWRPVPIISIAAIIIWLGWIAFMIGLTFLKKKYVWVDGSDLVVGSKRTPLHLLRPEAAVVKSGPGWANDVTEIPTMNGANLVIRTHWSTVRGSQLMSLIASEIEVARTRQEPI